MTDAEAAAALEGAQMRLAVLSEWLARFPDDAALLADQHETAQRVRVLSLWLRRN